MIKGKKIVVVLPAYNAGKTLEKTYSEIPFDIVDEVILVDDKSNDDTVEVAKKLGIKTIIEHEKNLGYGANQKTCYSKALDSGADIIIMLHPDYQYTPKLIPSMAHLVACNVYQVVLGSRILGNGAIKGGMPVYKYVGNRVLTFIQNILIGQKLSEYHTGYRVFSADVLHAIPYEKNSSGFIFDNEILCQIIYKGYAIGEITCPAKYFEEASSINFFQSMSYGFGVLNNSVRYRLSKMRILKCKLYKL
ncbi:MAG: glycosyltransferase family 2 protein [Bacteroidota bacterium]|nr:glycosyltransferase family 2 protein [Bacteroidota bacterium]